MHVMEHKRHHHLLLVILHLLAVFLLTLSRVVVPAVDAIPVTRILALEVQGPAHWSNPEDKRMMEYDSDEYGRMDFQKNDYSGWGANNRHDPRLPAGGRY